MAEPDHILFPIFDVHARYFEAGYQDGLKAYARKVVIEPTYQPDYDSGYAAGSLWRPFEPDNRLREMS